ncbi:BrnA antitoxin family protein [Thauera sp. Sel9]|uniref:BrnA antitoxin family protein n=1 Tax=Thauera sp. Sel9 TaxID=2974299 RepID=UPI0021E18B8F|nr:BrnA antitoxin family protein [Thauera sp. Sel9]MCV2218888.1 BrnA antitoxin family protein [Thauera sp. Sel9]
MNPHSKTDWARVKREAEADAPVPFDADGDPYDPNDEAAVEAFAAQALITRRRGPQKAPTKVPTTIRFDADVLAALKATGPGWQTRVNAAMREWVRSHVAR